MRRRIARNWRPLVEPCERRALLSVITDVMAANAMAGRRQSLTASLSQSAGSIFNQTGGGGSFVPSTQSIAIPANQGPPQVGVNLALTPTGTLTHRQLRREMFTADFKGTYTVGAGRTSTESTQTVVTAVGSANTMIHCDIQMLMITPKDRSAPIGGVCGIFDRNLNSNTSLGLDLLTSQQNVDRGGRPDHFPSVTADVNFSAGVYVGSYAQGVVNIRYVPSGKREPGVFEHGTAYVKIHAQIYTSAANFILRNAGIDP
jgi:hypothetical protein